MRWSPNIGLAAACATWLVALMPARGDATLTASFQHRAYYLGEPLVVDIKIHNGGGSPFTVWANGMNFFVKAFDERGVQVSNRAPSSGIFSTRGWNVDPGADSHYPVLLTGGFRTDLRFLHPGRYRLEIQGEFPVFQGPGVPAVNIRASTAASLDLRELTAAQAARLVAAIESSPDHDFTSCRHPLFLAPLVALASAGDRSAVSGINQIATPSATSALLQLSENARERVALQAFLCAQWRLYPAVDITLPSRLFAHASPPPREPDSNEGQRAQFRALVVRLSTRPGPRGEAARLVARALAIPLPPSAL